MTDEATTTGRAPKLYFRLARPVDAPAIQRLVQSAYRGDESRAGWTTEADLLSGPRIDEAGILAKMTDPDSAVLVATTSRPKAAEKEQGGECIVGCCELTRRGPDHDDLVYFGLFAVSPGMQGGGIGRRVLEAAEDYARREWRARRMEMAAIWTRAELIAWYARRGYRPTGETRPFPVDEIARAGGAPLVDDLHFVVLEKDLEEAVRAWATAVTSSSTTAGGVDGAGESLAGYNAN